MTLLEQIDELDGLLRFANYPDGGPVRSRVAKIREAADALSRPLERQLPDTIQELSELRARIDLKLHHLVCGDPGRSVTNFPPAPQSSATE